MTLFFSWPAPRKVRNIVPFSLFVTLGRKEKLSKEEAVFENSVKLQRMFLSLSFCYISVLVGFLLSLQKGALFPQTSHAGLQETVFYLRRPHGAQQCVPLARVLHPVFLWKSFGRVLRCGVSLLLHSQRAESRKKKSLIKILHKCTVCTAIIILA